jgi:predicted ribosome-associated RNA-binding protein Tma20
LKRVELKEGVEKFIFNGANLMWPGVNMVEN